MNTTAPQNPDSPSTPASRRVSPWWRMLAVFLVLVVLIGWAASASMLEQLKAQIGHLQTKVSAVPQIRHIAVLLDAEQKPAMLVTLEPTSGVLQVQRLNEVKEGRLDAMHLWALQGAQPPRSLGVITSKFKTLQMPAPAGALDGADQLAISVENKETVTEVRQPSLPWLFRGWLVQKAL
jgi:anti-sigma-K factor RskA